VRENVAEGSAVRTDGWIGYDTLPRLGYWHQPVVMSGDPTRNDKHIPLVHLIFSNLKTWLHGTHHGVSSEGSGSL
jgi:hypothetical protein